MFDIGMTEMLMIAVVAIIVVGPKDLPGMLRTIGRYAGQIRSMAREFQGQMDSAIKEAELDGVRDTLKDVQNLNPVNQIKNEVSDYMDSARALDEPDEAVTTGEAIDTGVPTDAPQTAPGLDAATEKAKAAQANTAKAKSAPKSKSSVKPAAPANDASGKKSGVQKTAASKASPAKAPAKKRASATATKKTATKRTTAKTAS